MASERSKRRDLLACIFITKLSYTKDINISYSVAKWTGLHLLSDIISRIDKGQTITLSMLHWKVHIVHASIIVFSTH